VWTSISTITASFLETLSQTDAASSEMLQQKLPTVTLLLTYITEKLDIHFLFYSKINQLHNISNLHLFWNITLHVSDSLSVHHQESNTVHTASGICSLRLLMIDGETVRNM